MSIAMRLAHRPGALLTSLESFARHQVNLLKIESRPIHGRPWEDQFFLDVESERLALPGTGPRRSAQSYGRTPHLWPLSCRRIDIIVSILSRVGPHFFTVTLSF